MTREDLIKLKKGEVDALYFGDGKFEIRLGLNSKQLKNLITSFPTFKTPRVQFRIIFE